MLQKPIKTKIRLYSIIALALTFCLILTVAASLSFSPKASVQDQSEESNLPDSAAFSDNLSSDISVNGTDEQTQNVTQENVSLITQEQALNISMPIIDQFVIKYNLTLLSVNTTFAYRPDNDGLRGGPSLYHLVAENLSSSEIYSQLKSYPVWTVTAKFNPVTIYGNATDRNGEPYTWYPGMTIESYLIRLWADNGQIFYSSKEPLVC